MTSPPGAEKKIDAGICGILFGWLGIHKFILGYIPEGTILLCASLLTCGCLIPITGGIGLIEGIIYLAKTDEDFVATYITNKRNWL
ncbi:MAG: TM2 domain-containing protein [Chitinivibrionia bacterium]|nr:TM2 domain-containing protein [Chitinivibrionia bacterium]